MIRDINWMVFKDFVDKKDGSAKRAILNVLPKKISDLIESLPSTDPQLKTISAAAFLDFVHPSWYTKSFSFLSRNEASLFSLVVPKESQGIFQNILKEEDSSFHLNPLSYEYLSKELLRRILRNEKYTLPLSYLPFDLLNPIVYISKEDFKNWFQLLVCYDLVEELHLVIDKNKVKTLQEMITLSQARFLKLLKQKKDKNLFPALGLTRWNGERSLLESSLSKRALQRLGTALSHSDKSFISYIKLRLSIHEAEELERYIHPSLSPKVVEKAKEQVLKALDFITSNADGKK